MKLPLKSTGRTILPFLLFPAICLASKIPVQRIPTQAPARIRVRLAEAVPLAVLRGFDLRIFQTEHEDRRLAVQAERGTEWEFRCQEGRIRATEKGGPKTLDLAEPIFVESPSG